MDTTLGMMSRITMVHPEMLHGLREILVKERTDFAKMDRHAASSLLTFILEMIRHEAW